MSKKRGSVPPLPESSLARIAFLGAAGKVTGSAYLIRTRSSLVLVDCGMHQGGKSDRALNRTPFAFDPKELDAVVLTHAHVDHSGLLPRLVAEGFRGRIHCSGGTADVAGIILPDAAHIQESDAKHKSRRLLRKGKPAAVPLYTKEDAERALEQLEPGPFRTRRDVTDDVAVRFVPAAHILGASHAELWIRDVAAEHKLVFSGDIGRVGQPMVPDPEPPTEADVVVMESTYGDRDHRDDTSTMDELAEILRSADAEGANVIIPVFAVGRAQEVLYEIATLEREGRAPKRDTVLDSPMAISVTELYRRNRDYLAQAGVARLEDEKAARLPARMRFTKHWTESAALNGKQGMTILSASGMCDAGRILHHLKHNLWRKGTRVVIVGWQAGGSLGRALVSGKRKVRVMGEEISVNATIHTLGGFSAHAGRTELLDWFGHLAPSKPRLVLTHGEPEKRAALAEGMRERFDVDAALPEAGDELDVPRSGERYELLRKAAVRG